VSRDVRATIVRCLQEIAPEGDPSALAPNADLREGLDLDSMDFLRFVQALHRELGVTIPEREYRTIATLDGCVRTCERLAG
jgi:acyl carrier protein